MSVSEEFRGVVDESVESMERWRRHLWVPPGAQMPHMSQRRDADEGQLGSVTDGEVTHDELAAMTDEELLACESEHHGDPYMGLLKAKGMQWVALQFWHVEAARTKANRQAEAQARRRLLQKLFPSDSGVSDSDAQLRRST